MIADAVSPEVWRALGDLLAATPEPPSADADPVQVLEQALAVTDARERHIVRMRTLLDGQAGLPGAAYDVLAELQGRDARWTAALRRAHHLLADRLQAVRRLRHVR
jgi:hypothetical protein